MYLDKIWDSDAHEEGENGSEGRQAASILGHTFPHISEIVLKVALLKCWSSSWTYSMKVRIVQIVFLNIYKKKRKRLFFV